MRLSLGTAAAAERLTRGELAVSWVIAGGGLLAVLDTTIVIVALPQFAAEFTAPLSSVQWIVTGYGIGTVATMPLAAAATRIWGARRSYIGALLAFAVASMLAAAAPGLGWLVAARIGQGMAGGLVGPVGMTLAFAAVSPMRRARTIAVTGLPLLIGPIAGPLLGGLLIDAYSWRSLFLITAPPALAAAFGAVRVIPRDPVAVPATKTGAPGVDVIGALGLVGGVVAVIGALSAEAAAPAAQLVGLLIGVGLITWFTRRSWRRPGAVLTVRLLADRNFGSGAAVLALYAAPYFGTMILMPTYIQLVRSDAALVSALLMIPGVLGMAVSIQASARALERFGSVAVVGTGLAFALVSGVCGVLVLRVDTPYWILAVLGALTGIGTGAVMMPTMAGATRNLTGADLASGSTLLQLISTVANAFGTVTVSVIFGWLITRLSGGRTLADLDNGRYGLAAEIVTALRWTQAASLVLIAAALVLRFAVRPVGRSLAGALSNGPDENGRTRDE